MIFFAYFNHNNNEKNNFNLYIVLFIKILLLNFIYI